MNNVINTKLSIVRNLKDYKFTNKLENEKRQLIIDKLNGVFDKKLSLINLENIEENVISLLLENNLIERNELPSKTKNIYIAKNEDVIIKLFNKEHIDVCATSIGYDIKNCFKESKELIDILKDKISLAYSDEYGYLTSDLARIGTGIKIECTVCLPCIKAVEKINQVKENLRNLGYKLIENSKETDEFTLSTQSNLGYTESQIYDEFEKMMTRLMSLELESAKMLAEGSHDEIIDKTMRSIAILNSAYLMPRDELKNHLTNIRTGINLNLIQDIDIQALNKIQKLITNKDENFVSKSELITLAAKTKEILKGE